MVRAATASLVYDDAREPGAGFAVAVPGCIGVSGILSRAIGVVASGALAACLATMPATAPAATRMPRRLIAHRTPSWTRLFCCPQWIARGPETQESLLRCCLVAVRWRGEHVRYDLLAGEEFVACEFTTNGPPRLTARRGRSRRRGAP